MATLIEHRVEAGAAFELHGVRFTPVPLLHGKLPVLGYRIERGCGNAERAMAEAAGERESPFPLAYCTDVSGVPPESWRLLKGARTLVLDALRHRKHPTHFTLGQAVSVAQQVGAERTYFVHMAHDLAHEETNAELPEGMELAYDGLVLGDGAAAKPAALQREPAQDPDSTP